MAGGVSPDAEVEALGILRDPTFRGALVVARIALDSSARNLRDSVEEVVGELADRGALAMLAQSLHDRGRSADAHRVTGHMARSEHGQWTTLSQALELARAVRTWRAELRDLDHRIALIGGARRLMEVRENIRKIFADGRSAPEMEAMIREIEEALELADLDLQQLLKLESKAIALVYGPAHERLVNEVLEKL